MSYTLPTGTDIMPRLLDSIDSPADLKELAPLQLEQLAGEIREELVTTVTTTGGHLASNLGVVELTIALHRIFDSPRDKIVWDVGHQSYVHKLLTGRRLLFPTLRQYEGLSGYTSPDESEHDPFVAGHASTSISAALGMAVVRDLAGDNYQVVAVIGDGAISGHGVTWHLGFPPRKAGWIFRRYTISRQDENKYLWSSGFMRFLPHVRALFFSAPPGEPALPA